MSSAARKHRQPLLHDRFTLCHSNCASLGVFCDDFLLQRKDISLRFVRSTGFRRVVTVALLGVLPRRMSLYRTENSGVSCVLGTMLVGVYPELCSSFFFPTPILETSKFLGVVSRTRSF